MASSWQPRGLVLNRDIAADLHSVGFAGLRLRVILPSVSSVLIGGGIRVDGYTCEDVQIWAHNVYPA